MGLVERLDRLTRLDDQTGIKTRQVNVLVLARSHSGRGLLERIAQKRVVRIMNEDLQRKIDERGGF